MEFEWSYFHYYLIVINFIGFLLFAVNTWLYSNTDEKQIDSLLTITSLLGGSLGLVIAILLIKRKAEKENMMSRVFVFSVLIIQGVVFLILQGKMRNQITFTFWSFFEQHKILLIYLIIMNLIAFAVFAIDKANAIKHKSRIRIVSLLVIAFFGGSIGGLIAMYTLRHKIRQDYFTVGLPLIVVMQAVVIFFLMNMK